MYSEISANHGVDFPPAFPQVSMETGLGNDAEHIDFDYNKFYDLANEHGVTDEEIAKLKILLTHDESTSILGRYIHRSREAKINLKDPQSVVRSVYETLLASNLGIQSDKDPDEFTPEDGVDAVVRHEIGHWVNNLGDRIGERQVTINKVVIKTVGFLAAAGIVVLPVATQEATTATITPAAGLFCLALYARIIHTMNGGSEPWHFPHEIPAYIFERDTRKYKLITYRPKNQRQYNDYID